MTTTTSISRTYLYIHLLSFPFWGIFNLLPIILHKELGANSLVIATMIALKPTVALFSPYWSQYIHKRPSRLRKNIFWASLLKFFPFLLFPFLQNAWYFIFSFALFMLLNRGSIPAWMELLKQNLPEKLRTRLCATTSTIDYLGVTCLAIPFGWILDNFHHSWRWLFLCTSFLGMISLCFIFFLPSQREKLTFSSSAQKGYLLAPWKNGITILQGRPDFFYFQWGFFLGGAGLMIVQPVIPRYFVNGLHLSYMDMLLAIALFKGIGYTLSSLLWSAKLRSHNIFFLCALVTLLASFFPLFLIIAKKESFFIYCAYLIYGIMQGGSELIWKMSGPIFSKEEDSSSYSSVNLLTVGIRGICIPYLGSLLFACFHNVYLILLCGTIFSLSATWLLFRYGKKQRIFSKEYNILP